MEVRLENSMLEPGFNPKCCQVSAQSPKDCPWCCKQERKRKSWPEIQEAQAALLSSPQLPSSSFGGVEPRMGEGTPSTALPTSKYRENSFLLFCFHRLPVMGNNVGPTDSI